MPATTIEREDEIVIHYSSIDLLLGSDDDHLIPKRGGTLYYSSNPREVTCPVCLRAIRELDR